MQIPFIQGLFDKGQLSQYRKRVSEINALEDRMGALQDQEFPSETEKLKARYTAGESLDVLLPEAFALAREAAKRTMGKRHYDVQLIGGTSIKRWQNC